jgi:hypothetical protein
MKNVSAGAVDEGAAALHVFHRGRSRNISDAARHPMKSGGRLGSGPAATAEKLETTSDMRAQR